MNSIEPQSGDLIAQLVQLITNESGIFGDSTAAAVDAFQNDMGLVVDGIAGSQTFSKLMETQLGGLKQQTEALIALYPELAQYVGKDGIFTVEIAQIETLIQDYTTLARQKAYAAMLGDIAAEYYKGEYDLAVLEEKKRDLEGQRKDQKGKIVLMGNSEKELKILMDTYFSGDAGIEDFENPELNDGTKGYYEAVAAAINNYITAYGGFDESYMAEFKENYDYESLFDAYGNVVATESNLLALQKLFTLLEANGGLATIDAKERLADLEEAIVVADEVLEEGKADFGEVANEYNIRYKVFNDKFPDAGVGLPSVWGSTMDESSADAGSAAGGSYTSAYVDAVLSRRDEVARAFGELIGAEPITKNIIVKLSVLGDSTGESTHATGLDYVPYNDYLARLHVGESVLTASEARLWREGGGAAGIDYSRLASAIAATAQPNQPVVLQIDGKTLASVQAENNRTAISDYNRRIALGRGKQ